jgi:porphobilinogen deaminase
MTRFFLTILFLCISSLAIAQSNEQQKKLEQRKAEIQREIRELNTLIKDESSNRC